jgi:uncharacterized protein YaaQ
VIAIVGDGDVQDMMGDLTAKGLRVTRIASSGGFLHRGSSTLLMGLQEDEVWLAVQTIKDYSERKKIKLLNEGSEEALARSGRTTVMVVDVEDFVQV